MQTALTIITHVIGSRIDVLVMINDLSLHALNENIFARLSMMISDDIKPGVSAPTWSSMSLKMLYV